jgi:hypothetical protein
MHTIPNGDSRRNTLPEQQCNSSTLSSSTADQLRPLAQLLHDLGPKSLYEYTAEIVQGAPPVERLKHYAALDPEVIRCVGGDRLRGMRCPLPPSLNAKVIPFPEQERYFKVRRSFVQSPDFMAMPSHAQAIYFHMSAKFDGWNNGRIEFSQRDAEAAAHISSRTARRELKRIEDAGFAVRTFKGSFNLKTGAAIPSTWYLPEFDRKLPTSHQGLQDQKKGDVMTGSPIAFGSTPDLRDESRGCGAAMTTVRFRPPSKPSPTEQRPSSQGVRHTQFVHEHG